MVSFPLAVVILNYNTRDLLVACVRSVQRFAPHAEIIVVDNASPDSSQEIVRKRFPNVHLIANASNRGFARGMNLGLRDAHAPFIFALNADTELTATTIAPLLDLLEQNPRAGIVAPAQVTAGDKPIHLASAFSDPTLAREAFRLLFFGDALAARLRLGPWRAIANGAARRADWVMGAALLFRRECLRDIVGFDESEFMYGEDWDICYRARRAGWGVYLAPCAEIIHHSNASGAEAFSSERQARVLSANLYFHEKHFGRPSRRALAFFHLIGTGLRLPLYLFDRTRWRAQIAEARVAAQGML